MAGMLVLLDRPHREVLQSPLEPKPRTPAMVSVSRPLEPGVLHLNVSVRVVAMMTVLVVFLLGRLLDNRRLDGVLLVWRWC
jgi:hypothetical protein